MDTDRQTDRHRNRLAPGYRRILHICLKISQVTLNDTGSLMNQLVGLEQFLNLSGDLVDPLLEWLKVKQPCWFVAAQTICGKSKTAL